MSTSFALRSTFLCVLLDLATASPLPTHLFKRELGSGAKAGLGIGIAVAIIIVLLIIGFFIVHLRRRAHNQALNNERAVLAGEKNPDGTNKLDPFIEERPTGGLKRNKSVKDRLMGPLYRGSVIDLPPVPRAYGNNNRSSTFSLGGGSMFNKPWASGENSPRPSFSSKRATRMMMMM